MPHKEALPTHTLKPSDPGAWSSYGEVDISASPDKVWKVITDTSNYPQWNRLMPRLELDRNLKVMEVGSRAELHTKPTITHEENVQTIQFQVIEANETLKWGMVPEDPELLEEWVFKFKAGVGTGSTRLETWITLAGSQAPAFAAADGKTLDDWMQIYLGDVKKTSEGGSH